MINSIGGQFQSTIFEFGKTSKKEKDLFNKLSTGKDINKASDDVVAIGRITDLNSKIRGINQSMENTSNGSSTLGTASGGLQSQLNSLQKLRDLAVQGADGSLSHQDRELLQNSANEQLDAINDTASQTQADGQPLLDGSFDKNLQVGPESGDSINVSIEASNTSSLGVDGIDLSTSSGSSSAIDAIDDAISKVTTNMARVGSAQNRLDSAYETSSSSRINYQQARSIVEDLDFAKAMGAIKQVEIQKNASSLIFNSIKSTEQTKLSFLA